MSTTGDKILDTALSKVKAVLIPVLLVPLPMSSHKGFTPEALSSLADWREEPVY